MAPVWVAISPLERAVAEGEAWSRLLGRCAALAISHASLITNTQRRKILHGLGLESVRRRRDPRLTRESPKASVRILVAPGRREWPLRRPTTPPAPVVQPLC